MSSIQGGMWRAPQNTKIPALSHVFSFRVTGVNPTLGAAATLVQLPATYSNAAQVTPAQNSVNYAPTASPVLPNNEPMQGLRLFVTQMVVRDANGTIGSNTTATNSTVIALIDQNYNSSGAYTPTVNNNAAAAANTVIALSNGTTTIPAAPAGGSAPYVVAQIGDATGVLGGVTADSTGLVVVNPYDQLAINFTPPAITGGTLGTATAFTVDVFGYWAQTI